VVSFVSAGLLTLTQSIGVLFGTNIGTTLTGWIISLIDLVRRVEKLGDHCFDISNTLGKI
jgi:phosphate:Na+ symporter